MEPYALTFVAVLLVCLMSLGLAVFSGAYKGRAGLLSGPVLDARDDNPLYRIDRVHMNSVEALGPFAIAATIAALVGVSPTLMAILAWLHLALRLAHLTIYLRGGNAAKGGNIRTVLYVSSALVTLIIMLLATWSALT